MGYLDGYLGGYLGIDESEAPANPYPNEGFLPIRRFEISFEDPGKPVVWRDLSSRVRSFTTRRGGSDALDQPQMGQGTVVLDNRDGLLSSSNPDSDFYGLLVPNRYARISADVGISPPPFTMKRSAMRSGAVLHGAPVPLRALTGFTGGFAQSWETSDAMAEVTIEIEDAFAWLAKKQTRRVLNLGDVGDDLFLFGGNTGDAIIALLARAGWPGVDATAPAPLRTETVDIDRGTAEFVETSFDSSVLDALVTVATTEGGRLFMSKEGRVTFRAANRERPVLAVYGDDPSELRYEDLRIAPSDQNLINDVTVSADYGEEGTATVSRSNPASIEHYGLLSKSWSVLGIIGTLPQRADELVRRYSIARERIVGLKPQPAGNRAAWRQALARELGDGIGANRRPPAGGDIIATPSIEGISIDAHDLEWSVEFETFQMPLESPNLLDEDQSSFESTSLRWTAVQGCLITRAAGEIVNAFGQLVAAPALVGVASFLIDPLDDVEPRVRLTDPIAVTAGDPYTAGAAFYSDASGPGAGSPASIEIEWLTPALTTIYTNEALVSVRRGSWTTAGLNVVEAPSGAVWARPWLVLPDSAGPAGWRRMFADGVYLKRIS